MHDFVLRMFSLDTNSLCLVIMISGWGFLIMRSMLDLSAVAVAAFPLLVLSALASHALLFDTAFILSLERGSGLAVTTGIGMIFALIVIVIAVRISLVIKDAVGRRPELLDRS
jgi:hypothetical protein